MWNKFKTFFPKSFIPIPSRAVVPSIPIDPDTSNKLVNDLTVDGTGWTYDSAYMQVVYGYMMLKKNFDGSQNLSRNVTLVQGARYKLAFTAVIGEFSIYAPSVGTWVGTPAVNPLNNAPDGTVCEWYFTASGTSVICNIDISTTNYLWAGLKIISIVSAPE